MLPQPLTDAVIGWVENSGRYFMFDAWVRGYSVPIVDPSQGIKNETGKIEDGITTISFLKKRTTKDSEYVGFVAVSCSEGWGRG